MAKDDMSKADMSFDEEIIDLTELIEPGEKGAGKAANAYARAAASTDDPGADDDFASILAETTGAPAKKTDPHEELDMSDMGGIDNLLESLDIPPQPRKRENVAEEPAQAPDDELDSVLDDLLGADKPAPKPAARQTPQKQAQSAMDADLDDILSSFDEAAPAKNEAAKPAPKKQPHDDLLSADLDDILADVEPPKPAPKAADIDDDLDDLLNGPASKTKPTPKTAPPAANLDDDLDALLNEPESRPKPAPKAAGIDDDLDDLLNEPAPKTKPTPEAAPPTANLDDDLDALLNEPAPKAAAKAPASPAPSAGFEDDLDAMLNAPAPKSPPKPAPAQTPKAAPKTTQPSPRPTDSFDLPDELDDILNEPAPRPAPKTAARPAPKAEPEPAASFDIPNDLAAIIDKPSPDAPEKPAAQKAQQPAPTLPAEMPGAPALPVQQAWSPDAFAAICRNIAAGGAQETLQEFSRELGSQTAHVQDMVTQMTQLSKRVLASESKLAAARARIAALEKGIESAAALEDLLKDGSPLHAGFMSLISSAVANALKSVPLSAPAPDNTALKSEVSQLRECLDGIDSRLSALEDKVVSYHNTNDNDNSGMKVDMEKLDACVWNADVRLEKLEQRMAELTDANAMEKAAAATVARVLHEEITRLAQS